MEMNEFIKHYIDVALSTKAFTQKEAETWVNEFYSMILKKPAPEIQLIDNPNILKQTVCLRTSNELTKLRKSIKQGLDKTVFKISLVVDTDISTKFQEVSLNIQKGILDVSEKLYGQFGSSISFMEGAFDAYVYAPYLYLYENKLLEFTDEEYKYLDLMMRSLNFGMIYPFDDVCYICKKPLVLSTIKSSKGNIQFHKDGGPAIVYPQWQEWYLNGVKVPQYIAETPASLLNPADIKSIDNADIRTEFIRKIGMERLVSMGTVVDTWKNHKGAKNYKQYAASEYKLINMADVFKDGSSRSRYVPYLYMKNLSVPGVYHLECVFDRYNQPRTILEALQVRLGGRNPEEYDLIAIK